MEENLREFFVDDVPGLHVYGRTGRAGRAVALFWTASGFAVGCTAGELWACLEADWALYEPWVSVWVNGAQVARFPVQKGRRWYCLFRGLPAGKAARVALLKETQAMSGDSAHCLLLQSLGVPAAFPGSAGRIFSPLPEPACRIEFVGDSITTGEGLAGGVDEMDWIPAWMALRGNYVVLTAQALCADFRILSQSGWGVCTGWDNDRACALPPFYAQTCGLAGGALNAALGAQHGHDFSSWQPDFVVVNLGTNDWGAFTNPPKTDPNTGEQWKLRLGADGAPVPEDAALFRASAVDFLGVLRAKNPRAHIVWVYGMVSFDLGDEIRRATEDFCAATGDSAVSFLRVPPMADEAPDERGSRLHPGPGTHRRAAAALTALLQDLQRTCTAPQP